MQLKSMLIEITFIFKGYLAGSQIRESDLNSQLLKLRLKIMAIQRTFSIVKPDAVRKNLIGAIYSRMEASGLSIVAAKMLYLTREQAEGFYAEHEGKVFFESLMEFMTSGPIMVQVLEGENAITFYRELMGATNPENAAAGTLRCDYAESMRFNAVHGSDSEESAAREIAYFFTENEVCPR